MILGSIAEVMRPKVGVPNVVPITPPNPVRFTPEQFAPVLQPARNEFGRLKASPRTFRLTCSRIGNVRDSAMLMSVNPGPRNPAGLTLPSVPNAGNWNAAGLSKL